MHSSDGKRGERDTFAPPVVESLEPRLLLTTMTVPTLIPGMSAETIFVYRNGEGNLIRVTLANNVTGVGQVELMRWTGTGEGSILSGAGNVANMPGWLDGVDVFGGIPQRGFNAAYQLNTDFPQWANPADVLAIGCDTGMDVIYAFDNNTSELWQVDPTTGQPVAPPVHVYDGWQPGLDYTVTAMDVEPSTGTIYAVGTLVDPDPVNPPALPTPAGPFLITIDEVTGAAYQVNPGVTVGANLTDIAFDPYGTLYGSDGTNLWEIDHWFTGTVQQSWPFIDASSGNAITNMAGLEYHNGVLYGQAGNNVFTISFPVWDAQNLIYIAECSPLNGTLSQADMTDLASDGTYLYGVFSSNDNTIITIINQDPPMPCDPIAVYVAEADEYTILTFANVEEQNDAPRIDYLHLWDASPTAMLNTAAPLRAPAGSGEVLLGAVHTPTPNNAFQHQAVSTVDTIIEDARALGCFPGGTLHAGVMCSGPMGEVVDYGTDAGLGRSVDALAANAAGELYAVDNLTHMLVRADYNPLTYPPSTATTVIGELLDAAEPSFRYDDVRALDFDSNGDLYGVGIITDTIPGDPTPPNGAWLIRIDTATGEVTRVAELVGASNIASIAFDASDQLYAVDGDTNSLATIDMATGVVTDIGEIVYLDRAGGPEINGIAFDDAGILYGVTETVLYRIDAAAAVARVEGEVGLTHLPALAFSSAYPGYLWSVTFSQQSYRLAVLDLANPALDFGRLLVAGTVAGRTHISGSLEVFESGMIWGNVDIGHDLVNMIVHTDVARDPTVDPEGVAPDNALTHVAGTLRELDVYGTMYGSVYVEGLPDVPVPDGGMVNWNAEPIVELEPDKPSGNTPYVPWAIYGELKTVNNDTPDQAQFLFNDSGSITLWGIHHGEEDGDRIDYYAISLMAGQTVRIDAYEDHITDPRLGEYSFLNSWLGLGVYDGNLNYMASVGFETIEDMGVGSRGYTQEALVFTAPQAGIYYLLVTDDYEAELDPDTANAFDTAADRPYTIFITSATSAALGALHVNGDLSPVFFGEDSKMNYDVAVERGNLGAVEVDGTSIYTRAFVFGGGDLVSFRAGSYGTALANVIGGANEIISHGNIGLVESTTVNLNAVVVAGADEGLHNKDAYIRRRSVFHHALRHAVRPGHRGGDLRGVGLRQHRLGVRRRQRGRLGGVHD